MDSITPVKVACRAEQDPINLFWAGLSLFWVGLVATRVLLIKFDHLSRKSNFYFNSYSSKKRFLFFSFFPSFSLSSGEDLFHTNCKIIIARLQILYKLTKTILYIDP